MAEGLWIAIALIGAATYATRAAPFLLKSRDTGDRTARGRDRLSAVGPCLLAAMAVTVFLSEIAETRATGSLLPLLVGSASVAVVMRAFRNPGLATLAGIVGWWLAG